MARRDIFRPRSRCGAVDFYADRLQMAAERSIVGPPAGQRNALADYTFEPADRRLENAATAHKSIEERGIMRSSARRRRSAIRQRRDWSTERSRCARTAG